MNLVFKQCALFLLGCSLSTAYALPTSPIVAARNIPVKPTHPLPHYQLTQAKLVNQTFNQLIPENMWINLTTFSQFPNRYSNSVTGVNAQNWLQAQVDSLVKASGRQDVSVRLIPTKNFLQSSIVVKIGDANVPGIVISAHMDTLDGAMPGADDDGSGTVSVLEITRLLLNSQLQFSKPIYLIWYAAEEEGLFGSEATVDDFMAKNIGVEAVLHFDMIGYSYKNDPTLWLVQDYTDPDLTAFLAELTKVYVKQPVGYTKCGYSCSDHATWNRQGFNAGFAYGGDLGGGVRAKDNPYFHTAQDTIDKLSLAHITDFTKLGIAFALETTQPKV